MITGAGSPPRPLCPLFNQTRDPKGQLLDGTRGRMGRMGRMIM